MIVPSCKVAGVGATLVTLGLRQSPVFAGQEDQGDDMNPSASTSGTPTIVLVHGGFADASSWNGVIDRLLTAQKTLAKRFVEANP